MIQESLPDQNHENRTFLNWLDIPEKKFKKYKKILDKTAQSVYRVSKKFQPQNLLSGVRP